MANAHDILSLAASQIGTKEQPADSNRVKYNTAYYDREVSGPSYPWCCVFVWWVFRAAKAAALFYGGEKTASCTTLYYHYLNNRQAVRGEYQPGDLVFFDFTGRHSTSNIAHIGIVESVAKDGKLITIEGNTGTGNDANGGTVMRRTRDKLYVAAGARPAYTKKEDDIGMTKGEVRRMIAEALADHDDAVAKAQNKPVSSWHTGEWAEAERLGLMDGTNPVRPALREQMAAMGVRLYALCKGGT